MIVVSATKGKAASDPFIHSPSSTASHGNVAVPLHPASGTVDEKHVSPLHPCLSADWSFLIGDTSKQQQSTVTRHVVVQVKGSTVVTKRGYFGAEVAWNHLCASLGEGSEGTHPFPQGMSIVSLVGNVELVRMFATVIGDDEKERCILWIARCTDGVVVTD